MKKNILRVVIGLATIYAAFTLFRDWDVYKEVWHKITNSSFERSIAAHTEDIKRKPRDPWPYSTRAMIYTQAKRYDEAIADRLKSIEVDKNFEFYTFDDLSGLYLLKGDTGKAREYLLKAKRIMPYPEKLLYYEALINDFEGKSQAAFEAYGSYAKLNNLVKKPKVRIVILKRRIANAVKLGNFETGYTELQQLQKELPNDKDISRILVSADKANAFKSEEVQNFLKLDLYEAIVEPDKME